MIEVPATDIARVLGELFEHVQDSNGVIRIDADGLWGSSQSRVYLRPEPSGLEQASGDVVGQGPGTEGRIHPRLTYSSFS